MNNFRHIDTVNPSGLSAQEGKKRDFVTCHVLVFQNDEPFISEHNISIFNDNDANVTRAYLTLTVSPVLAIEEDYEIL